MELVKNKRVTFNELVSLRDELRMQAQLFKGEAKTKWQSLESDFKRLKAAKPTVEATLKTAGKDVEAAGKLLKESLYNGYLRIRKTVSRPSSRLKLEPRTARSKFLQNFLAAGD